MSHTYLHVKQSPIERPGKHWDQSAIFTSHWSKQIGAVNRADCLFPEGVYLIARVVFESGFTMYDGIAGTGFHIHIVHATEGAGSNPASALKRG